MHSIDRPSASEPDGDPDIRETASLLRTRFTALLLERRNADGWWTGRLSTSALSTATAVMALRLASEEVCCDSKQAAYRSMVSGGIRWLLDNRNEDGGWGDTVLSRSNISTTMLVHATLTRCGEADECGAAVDDAARWIENAGGVPAVVARYGKDRTFSVPILTHCALAGTVAWSEVPALPFELACLPPEFYSAVRLPVVSYALPALIAIGQVIFRRKGHWNPVMRLVRSLAAGRSLEVLKRLQPENGGFLEATPLTSFVCMSLIGAGHPDHQVTRQCLEFIEASVLADGSWPIDTSLTTWVTTLSINAIAGDPHRTDSDLLEPHLSADQRHSVRQWLLGQQYREIHPYTQAAPGGWSWIDQPGGVPDADDTPGAMLAILHLREPGEDLSETECESLRAAATWLLDLQNRDGGWPTFCRGWGKLPFDRSSNDLTAHAMRALAAWQARDSSAPAALCSRTESALHRAEAFLRKTQRADGSWLPLWFGNQHQPEDENPLYGTAKVVLALHDLGRQQWPEAQRAVSWLLENQNDDGGWGGFRGAPSTSEETGLALEALAAADGTKNAVRSGLCWLNRRWNEGSAAQPAPIGFYFAKLWYFEELYPIIFALGGVVRVSHRLESAVRNSS